MHFEVAGREHVVDVSYLFPIGLPPPHEKTVRQRRVGQLFVVDLDKKSCHRFLQ